MKYTFIITTFFNLFITPIYSQIYLNEISSSNQEIITDEFGDTPDWVELYNAGETTVNLAGYYLSDSETNFTKWQFPNVDIAAKGFLLLFASGNDLQETYVHTNFKLASSGEVVTLSDPNRQILDQIKMPKLTADISYGREQDGNESWVYFRQATPEATNNDASQVTALNALQFSVNQQFQSEKFSLELTHPTLGVEIYYTLDGRRPDDKDVLYTSPILIEKNTVVRAIAMIDNSLPSPIATKTYFINVEHTLPIIALSTNPDNLFDEEEGIFNMGPDADANYPFYGANFWKNIEIAAHFEYFNQQQELKVSYDIGTKIHGGRGARSRPQKSMRLLAEHEFGADKIEFPFFKNKPTVNRFERLVLRNQSGDFNAAHFRDGYLSRLFLDFGVQVDMLAYQPCIWYINGEYWGVISLREKSDEFYVESNYGFAPEQIDMLEEDTLIIVGDFTKFDEHYAFTQEQDLRNDEHFETAASFFDIKNIADYFIIHSAVNAADWLHNNTKYWREKSVEGKWKYISFDLDIAMARHNWTNADVDVFGNKMLRDYNGTNRHVNILTALLDNKNYHDYFINRYCDLLNTVMRPETFEASTIAMKEELQAEMQQHFNRWSNCYECYDYEYWDENQTIKAIDFARERPPFARQYIQEYFNLPNQILLELEVVPAFAGKIQINTITPDKFPWDGYYFNGVPVTLTAIPNTGFEFETWEVERNLQTIADSPNLSLNFENDDKIIAHFSGEYTGLQLQVNPNPLTSSDLTMNLLLPETTDLSIQIFAANGQLVQTYPKQTVAAGPQNISLITENLPQGVYYLRVLTEELTETISFAVVR